MKIIQPYFSNRTHCVKFFNVLFDFDDIICGVPQGSVLGQYLVCTYCLSAILKYHRIGYHVHADDTQLYISLKGKQPLETISKVNSCLSDIRRWMTTNKFKINDLNTEGVVFRSPQLMSDLSGLSVSVILCNDQSKFWNHSRPISQRR